MEQNENQNPEEHLAFSSRLNLQPLQEAIGKIKDIEDFWLNLPVLPKAKELLGLIKQVKGKYKICTSPLADDPRSEPHKREWVKKNLSFFIKVDILFLEKG